MLAKGPYYPENTYYAGTLEVINQAGYEEMTRIVHILPNTKDHYPIDHKYYLWCNLFDFLENRNYGATDLQPKTETYYNTLMWKVHYATMGATELRVLFQGVFITRSENYSAEELLPLAYPSGKVAVALELQQQALLRRHVLHGVFL